MPYTKLPWLAYADQVVGFQSINDAQDNLVEHSDVLFLRHGSKELGGPLGSVFTVEVPRQFGNHNDVRIPRSMQYLSTVAVVGTAVGGVSFGRPTLGGSSQNVVTRLDRLGTGQYFAAIIGLTQYFADPVPTVSAAGDVRRVLQTPVFSSQGAEPGIFFQTEELDGSNDFLPVDFDFSFAIYGTV